MSPVPIPIHYARDLPPEELAQLRALLDERLQLSVGTDIPQPAQFEILVEGVPSRAWLTASPRLHTLVIPWAGLPHKTAELWREFPQLRVHNLHYNAQPVAEMALALLTAVAKRLVPIDQRLRQGDWRPRYQRTPPQSIGLVGKTALILGYGAIGQALGRMCVGLGMRVWGVRRRVAVAYEDTAVGTTIFPASQLPELLPQTNFLLCCLPRTAVTEGLIGAEQLHALADPAIVVNIGRAEVIQEKALYEALASGKLWGAGLDVWYNYPTDEASRTETLPSQYPFHQLDNVVLSPHRASDGDDTEGLWRVHLADLLNHAARGEPLPNLLDPAVGY